MIFRSGVLLLTAVVQIFAVINCASAQMTAYDRQLEAIVQSGLDRPLVSVIPRAPIPNPISGLPTSLETLAESCGLKVYDQDGICVIASADRFDLADLASKLSQIQRASIYELTAFLHASFDERQLMALGSQNGLHFSQLNRDQQNILVSLFSEDNVLVPAFVDDMQSGLEAAVDKTPASGVNIQDIVLHARLRTSTAEVRLDDDTFCDINLRADPGPGEAPFCLEENPSNEDVEEDLSAFMVPNTLKPSDLNYQAAQLNVPVTVIGEVTLEKLIKHVSSKTALKLLAPPGSGNVALYINAKGTPAGKILRAVSLAVHGAWRKIGDAYLFAFDSVGSGRIMAEIEQARRQQDALRKNAERITSSPQWADAVRRAIPLKPDDLLQLTSAQLAGTLMDPAYINDSEKHLSWQQFSGTQREIIIEEINRQALRIDEETGHKAPEYPRLDMASVSISFSLELLAEVPGVGLVDLSGPNPFGTEYDGIHWFDSDAPKDTRIALKSPCRGLLLAPSRSDKPGYVLNIMNKHNLNTLFLRIFFDGYTIFPSSHFPQHSWSKEGDYLKQVLDLAHSIGVKVIAVVDVLRWSDGSKKHWLYNNPGIIDFDLVGRTTSQMNVRDMLPSELEPLLPFAFGNAFQGDAVTPFQPAVLDKITGLLNELTAYPVDGIAFDYTFFRLVHEFFLDSDCADGPGYADAARVAFVNTHGLDPADIYDCDSYGALDIIGSTNSEPLMPLLTAASDMREKWRLFYRKACDDLLDSLICKWRSLTKESPIWVVDTFGYGNSETSRHDWQRFKGRIEGVLNLIATDTENYPGHGLKNMLLLRPQDSAGNLLFASFLAGSQGQTFEGIDSSIEVPKETGKDGIVIELSNVVKRRQDILRLIAGP